MSGIDLLMTEHRYVGRMNAWIKSFVHELNNNYEYLIEESGMRLIRNISK